MVRFALVLGMMANVASANCRQALALGLDVSGSVDEREYRLQLDGLAAALQSDEVRAAMIDPSLPPVRIAVYEWAGSESRRLLLDWTTMDDDRAIEGVATRLRATERTIIDTRTGLGPAIAYGAALLDAAGDCPTMTLDISGDGRANHGARPEDTIIAPYITVNGLVIGADAPATGDRRQMQVAEIASYYTANVIRGRDAFVEVALGFDDYEEAMTRKLVRELRVMVLGKRPRPDPVAQ